MTNQILHIQIARADQIIHIMLIDLHKFYDILK